MKNTYFSTAIGLYFNYGPRHGVILMSLNMSSLEHQWQTNAAGVSIVISSLGIGRLSVLLMAGMLSDRYGRRPFIIFGMICYLIFFVGIINTHSIFIAYAFGFLAGMANSFLDAGTYPSLMEAFPRSPSTANILIKAFVSSGQFLLPMIISLLVWAELWFGWSFLLAAAIMIINGVFCFAVASRRIREIKLPSRHYLLNGKHNNLNIVVRFSILPVTLCMAISPWRHFIW